jgi:hypothetical protein
MKWFSFVHAQFAWDSIQCMRWGMLRHALLRGMRQPASTNSNQS